MATPKDEADETPVEGGDEEDIDVDEMFGSDTPSGSDSDAPLKPKPKLTVSVEEPTKKTTSVAAAPVVSVKPTAPDSTTVQTANIPGTDDEASEDNDHELTPWEHINMKPAIDVMDKLSKTCVDAAKDFNASVVATTHQLVAGCDSVLLEIKHISDIRESMKRKSSAAPAAPAISVASHALGTSMLPPSTTSAPSAAAATMALPAAAVAPLDKATEDQTDRVLYKIEASIEKFRELAEMIQTTSMHQEALLLQKLHVPPASIQTMVSAIHNAAAAATSAAIAQDRHRAVARPATFTSDQRTKLQTWYYAYPRPLADELDLMSSILAFPPYATSPVAIHPQHVRDWFKRRRFRERMRLVMQAIEGGAALHAAEADVRARMELRIQTLREAVSPDELVRELDHVRLSSSIYSTVSGSFGHKRNLDQFLSAASRGSSSMMAAAATAAHVSVDSKRPRVTSSLVPHENEVEEAIIVKVASKFEIEAVQARLRALLKAPKTTANTNSIQQAMDVLRSLDIAKELCHSTHLVADLKRVLKVYKKPSLLRRTTEALLDTLGQATTSSAASSSGGKKTKRAAISSSSAPTPPPPPPPPLAADTSTPAEPTRQDKGKPASSSSSKRKKGAKLLRPMKFSMKQVEALEAWFQKTFKPSQTEMEEYLDALNATPLREPKQSVDVNMTQLRRWFNKRRCLRRPPFALMTKDKKDDDDDATPDDDDDDDDDDDEGDDAKSNASGGAAAAGDVDMGEASGDDDDDDDDESE
ncbi:Aste57867_15852 [Aphanomyces stellatus]|uniref:Aste57867_15852 protein n=1 Tax=Aphanomyces stellatus TaxID=120398 RepID=A0A485L428_9STRA|nr:hypothetical protein As57867_015796 [Aphanomyces stellatus]VFT92639.1 Aste57867_15852 [Aphanomyces stellatus]